MQRFETQEERLDYLLQKFKEDSVRYKDLALENDYNKKRMVLRSLMNIRPPRELSDEIMAVQNEFLTIEAKEKGIVTLSDIFTIKEQYGSNQPFADKISIWQGDITRLRVDAIVNAANSQMLGCFVPCHGCIDNAIHSAAGIELREECNRYMNKQRIQFGQRYEEPTGSAMLTKGYNLPAKYVIHTVGPIVSYRLTQKLRHSLRECYRNILKCCVENDIKSVAFCCISTGEYHFPNDEAAKIAVEETTLFLEKHSDCFKRVIFNVFKDIDKKYYEEQFADCIA